MKNYNAFTLRIISLMLHLGIYPKHPIDKVNSLYKQGKISMQERDRRIAKYIERVRAKCEK